MKEPFSKVNVRQIVSEHFNTLYSFRSPTSVRRISKGDISTFFLTPALAATLIGYFNLRLTDTGSILAGVSLFGGLLFALLVLLLQQASDAAIRTEDDGEPSDRTLQRTTWLREIAANVAYCVLVCLTATGLLVASLFSHPSSVHPTGARWLTIALTYVLVHLFLTLLMVMKRTFSTVAREIDRARVPASRG